jgi:CDP-6-deoxy-D-xylo-4-hexulose-3-dehydrase
MNPDGETFPKTFGPWPLMQNNISRQDLDSVISLLEKIDPILTQSSNVRAFEQEWSEWLGVKHSVFVNSGASANLLSMAALRHLRGEGEVIVPTLTWVSDIASVLQSGLTPIFVDIDPQTLGMDIDQVIKKLSPRTRAVFLTHVLGYNGLDQRLLNELAEREIPLIEDVCESHGATFKGQKLGSFGWLSNFSFYYAHHLSTIEGGMVCTDDPELYQTVRMLRSHGMVRESDDPTLRAEFKSKHPDLNPDFIFALPSYNVRSTEINAVIGRSQLKRLDTNNALRTRNLITFLQNLDSTKYQTDFRTEGSSNYAFTLVLKDPDFTFRDKVEATLSQNSIEFRRGSSGGGNQLRQPYLRRLYGDAFKDFPRIEHVHHFSWYIGNYPTLDHDKIPRLCSLLNSIEK